MQIHALMPFQFMILDFYFLVFVDGNITSLHGAVESKEQYSAESTPSSLVGSFGSYANHQICLLKYSTNLQMNTAKDSILHLTMNK